MSSEVEQGKGRVTVRTSVAVRGESGFYFGTLRWIEEKRVLVEIDADLAEHEALDVRITLSPTPATALFRGNVLRALATAPGESARYLILIREFVSDDADKFQGWLQNVRSRGTFSNFDTVISGVRSADDGRAPPEVRQALEKLSRRPTGSSPPTDPFGERSDIDTNGGPGAGRGAVRDALRSALARRGTAPGGAPGRVVASAPPPGQRVPDGPGTVRIGASPGRVVAGGSVAPEEGRTVRLGGTPSVPPDGTVRIGSTPSVPPDGTVRIGSTPSTPPDGTVRIGGASGLPSDVSRPSARDFAPVHPPVRDPSYATTTTRSATWMEVRWHDPSAFERDARLQLCNYILVLARGVDLLPDREPLRVMIRHADVQVECAASIKAMGPNGATYRLLLDALQLERLRNWIADYGRK